MSLAIDVMRRANFKFMRLDFEQHDVTYYGHRLPIGTLASDVLNIPQETMDRLCELTSPMMHFIDNLHSGKKDFPGIELSRSNAYLIVELLKDVPPFSYMDEVEIRTMLDKQFDSQNLKRVKQNLEKRKDAYALKFVQVVCLIAQLGFSLTEFRKVITTLEESLNDDTQVRTPEGYARLFKTFFPLTEADEKSWMSLTNVSMQYLVSGEPERLVRRMHYTSFVGMYRSDLFEGLSIGHGPRKCGICGRWFVTTDARHTKYCGGLAPGDALGRTCRQIGNIKGRESRELANDHPLKKIYSRRMDAINKAVHRGAMDRELAIAMKRLAKDKMLRALSNVSYANGSYKAEMEQGTLMAEARKRL